MEITLQIPPAWPTFNEFFGYEPKSAFRIYGTDGRELSYQRLSQATNRTKTRLISEIMTILIAFHQSHYSDFKAYYCEHVLVNWRSEFPGLVSYTRFVEYIPSALVPLIVYLRTSCLGHAAGSHSFN